MTRVWEWPAWVLSVTDGDTLKVIADRGDKDYSEFGVRLARVDAAEMRTEGGISTRLWVLSTLVRAGHVQTTPDLSALIKAKTTSALLTAALGKPLTVVSKGIDKYGRILGEVKFGDDINLADLLLAEGRAHPYDGGPR